MTTIPNIGVVGTGYWGKNLVRNFAELGTLAAISDLDVEQVQKLSKEYNCKVSSWNELLENRKIDAIAIATPAKTHFNLAYEALNAGKHVFVEKPLALKDTDAEILCRLAKEKGLKLMVGHLLQYHPAYIKLKQMVLGGDLGKLLYIYSNRLSLGKVRREEDILWSFAPHDISMILGLVGSEPISVKAEAGYYLHKSIADVTTTHLAFQDGVRAHIFVSWLHPYKEQKLVVIGDKAMAVFDDTKDWSEKLILYPHLIEWREGQPLPSKKDSISIFLEAKEPLREECTYFQDCIIHDRTPLTDGNEGTHVLKVLQKASESLNLSLESNRTSQEAKTEYYAHPTACIDAPVQIGKDTKIWHYSHILGNTQIGEKCVIGQNVMIGPDVKVGNNCKIQNNVSLYKGTILEDGVFCGPSCVFTNVNTPRAEIERKDEFLETIVEKGCTIGANATVVCGNRLGAYSFIGAGSVVTKDVPPHALVVGNPARQIGWVSHAGERLGDDLICPREGRKYEISSNNYLIEINEYLIDIVQTV